MVRRWAARAVVLLLSTLSWGLGTGVASAHTSLQSSSPADGAALRTAPPAVVLRFDDPVDPALSSLRLVGPGTEVRLALTRTSPSLVLRAPLPRLGPGDYRIEWRVPGSDGHAATGVVSFRVEGGAAHPEPGVAEPAAPAAAGRAASALYGLSRWVALLGFAALLGGALFATTCLPQGCPRGRVPEIGAALVAAGSASVLLLYGPSVGGLSLTRALDPDVLEATLRSTTGVAVLARLALLALAAILLAALRQRVLGALSRPARTWLTLSLGAALATTWSLTGHSRTSAASTALDAAHLVAAAVWLGGLLSLLLVLRTPAATAAAHRFSSVAVTAVVVLVVTGSAQAVLRLGSLASLTELVYGRLLLLKLGLVAATLGVAGLVRLRLRRTATPVGVRRGVVLEAALGVAVLGVATGLVVSSPVAPPRHPAEPSVVPAGAVAAPQAAPSPTPGDEWVTASLPYDTGGASGVVDVAVLPAVGATSIHVSVLDQVRRPVAAQVSAALRAAEGGAARPVRLAAAGAGHFISSGARVPTAGSWQLGLALVLPDGRRTVLVAGFTAR